MHAPSLPSIQFCTRCGCSYDTGLPHTCAVSSEISALRAYIATAKPTAFRREIAHAMSLIDRFEAALKHVRASAQTGTSDAGVVISYAALSSVLAALDGASTP